MKKNKGWIGYFKPKSVSDVKIPRIENTIQHIDGELSTDSTWPYLLFVVIYFLLTTLFTYGVKP